MDESCSPLRYEEPSPISSYHPRKPSIPRIYEAISFFFMPSQITCAKCAQEPDYSRQSRSSSVLGSHTCSIRIATGLSDSAHLVVVTSSGTIWKHLFRHVILFGLHRSATKHTLLNDIVFIVAKSHTSPRPARLDY